MKMHDDEILVSDEVARNLIAGQFPEWSQQPILRIASNGTVNTIFRIGDGFAARLPLRPDDPESMRQVLEEEALANVEFTRYSPFPSPIPIAIGTPGPGYPLPLSQPYGRPRRAVENFQVEAAAVTFAIMTNGLRHAFAIAR